MSRALRNSHMSHDRCVVHAEDTKNRTIGKSTNGSIGRARQGVQFLEHKFESKLNLIDIVLTLFRENLLLTERTHLHILKILNQAVK